MEGEAASVLRLPSLHSTKVHYKLVEVFTVAQSTCCHEIPSNKQL